jgi:hypothetical protein
VEGGVAGRRRQAFERKRIADGVEHQVHDLAQARDAGSRFHRRLRLRGAGRAIEVSGKEKRSIETVRIRVPAIMAQLMCRGEISRVHRQIEGRPSSVECKVKLHYT